MALGWWAWHELWSLLGHGKLGGENACTRVGGVAGWVHREVPRECLTRAVHEFICGHTEAV